MGERGAAPPFEEMNFSDFPQSFFFDFFFERAFSELSYCECGLQNS